MTKPLPLVNVGVDVSKDTLDVHLLERNLSLSVPNLEPEISSLIKRLALYRLERIVVEAAGRLEHAFVSAAIAKGLPDLREGFGRVHLPQRWLQSTGVRIANGAGNTCSRRRGARSIHAPAANAGTMRRRTRCSAP